MKKARTVIFAILCVLLLIGGFMVIKRMLLNNKVFDDPLSSYSYTRGGGMDGSFENEYVKLVSDGKAIIYRSKNEWWNAPFETYEYIVDGKILNDIQEVFYEYKMSGYSDLPRSKIVVLDAPSHDYEFMFGDVSVRFGSGDIVPEKGREALREMDRIIDSYCTEENRLPRLIFERDDEAYSMSIPKNGEVMARVFKYGERKLEFQLMNGTSEAYPYDHSYKLYLNDELIGEGRAGGYMDVVNSQRSEDYSISLDDYLKPGIYRLEAGELSTEFEIQ